MKNFDIGQRRGNVLGIRKINWKNKVRKEEESTRKGSNY